MPAFKAKEVIAILKKLGYIQKRQTGSHLIMYHLELKRAIPVPLHAKDVRKGLLHSIIKQADSTLKEFLKLK
ncbi:MAG: type II toxin-antitoxin system HicA family toxin [Candidatus Blackburnbacteria bacterium]|nr:type II toxin-antitoxin system HicA family toxin [Candidatus Blackburnbacteria bacterium]